MPARTGEIIDQKFEVLCELGRGAFGTVYKARHRGLDRLVALKILDCSVDESALQRFEREAQVISQLKHRNIVTVYGVGRLHEQPYMAMEFVDGESLEQLLGRETRLTPSLALEIIGQVCDGLSCAHKHGIVHRDLKPENIILTNETPDSKPIVRIIDFGLAGLMNTNPLAKQKLTAAGTAIGTVLYMSPEQCSGSHVDARSDIYALGCILHECLAGTPPFTGQNEAEVMMQQAEATPPSVKDVVGRRIISEELQSVIDRALRKNPNNRFQSAAELSEALAAAPAVILDETPSASVAKSETTASKAGYRKKTMAVLAGLVFAVAISFYVSGNLPHHNSDTRPSQACFREANTIHRTHPNDPDKALELEHSLLESAASKDRLDFLLDPEQRTTTCLRLANYYRNRGNKALEAEALKGAELSLLGRTTIDYDSLTAILLLLQPNQQFAEPKANRQALLTVAAHALQRPVLQNYSGIRDACLLSLGIDYMSERDLKDAVAAANLVAPHLVGPSREEFNAQKNVEQLGNRSRICDLQRLGEALCIRANYTLQQNNPEEALRLANEAVTLSRFRSESYPGLMETTFAPLARRTAALCYLVLRKPELAEKAILQSKKGSQQSDAKAGALSTNNAVDDQSTQWPEVSMLIAAEQGNWDTAEDFRRTWQQLIERHMQLEGDVSWILDMYSKLASNAGKARIAVHAQEASKKMEALLDL